MDGRLPARGGSKPGRPWAQNLGLYGLAALKGSTGSSPGSWGTPRDLKDRVGNPIHLGAERRKSGL